MIGVKQGFHSHARLNSSTTMLADLLTSITMITTLLALLELAHWLFR